MCDYSLHHVATRPAQIEDKLVTTRFNNSITRGFAAVGEPNVAVCLLPGTELAFDVSAECERLGGMLPSKKIGQRLARFRQINVDPAVSHRDALESGGATHPPVRGPARNRIAIAGHRTSCGRK